MHKIIAKTSYSMLSYRSTVNMEATELSVYAFIYKMMCSRSQQICEKAIGRTRMRRKRAKFFLI